MPSRPAVIAAFRVLASGALSDSAAPSRSAFMLYNSLLRKKQAFRPRAGQDNHVTMYVCGVTVYDYRCAVDPLPLARGGGMAGARKMPRVQVRRGRPGHARAHS